MLEKIILEEKKNLVYEFMLSKEYKPIKFKEMVNILQVPKREKEDLREVLESLIADGKIIIDVKGKFKVANENLNPEGLWFRTCRRRRRGHFYT